MNPPVQPDNLGGLLRFLGHRLLLGELAIQNGYATAARIEECLAEQQTAPQRSLLGEVLVARKAVTAEQLSELLRQQALLEELDGSLPSTAVLGMLGEYALVEKLGEGAGGTVWKAWDVRLHRWVAVKRPKLEPEFSRDRFLREARAAAKLRHPNLVEVFEIGHHDGRDFIVMNYVEGNPLHTLRLEIPQLVRLFEEVAEAVAAMHACGILHRDIKPQNIFVDRTGKGTLGDFGLAKDLAARSLTQEGSWMGTPLYMAPEQASGAALGPETDVYGLGSALYHAVTGRAPFEGESSVETLLQKLQQETPPSPRRLRQDLSPELEAIILCAMKKRPGERYPSAAELAADLRRLRLGEPVRARPPGTIRRGVKWMRRNPRLLAALLLAAAGFGVAGAVAIVHWTASNREAIFRVAYNEGLERWLRAVKGHRPPEAVEAISWFERAEGLAVNRPEPLLMKGRCLMFLGRPDEAAAAWTEALGRDPAYGPALLERGKYYVETYVRRRLPPAVRVSESRVRLGTPPAESDEDRSWREKGEADLAEAREAVGLEQADLKLVEVMLAFGRGKYDEAASVLEPHIRDNPWDIPALTLHAAACVATGAFDRAEDSITRALNLDARAHRYKTRGDIRMCAGKPEEAVSDYTRALEAQPEDASVLCNRALALEALDRPEEALQDYSRALMLQPRLARAYNGRGALRCKQLDFEGAEEDFLGATDIDPAYAEAYHNLGNLRFLQGRVGEAVRQYGLAIQMDPCYAEAYAGRARARCKIGELVEGLGDYEKAIHCQPGNPDLLLEFAGVLRGAGAADRARETLRRALDVSSPDWAGRRRVEELLREWR
ncbi:MAG: protein kinase [Planctomycetes bacterium]|nr:protein kinase [Planctomycetota bacterium]